MATITSNIELKQYRRGRGWSSPLNPGLDSDQTLVVAFVASGLRSDPSLIAQLADTYPQSHLIGCSTAGEIMGSECNDDSASVAIMRFSNTRLLSASQLIHDVGCSRDVGQSLGKTLADPALRAVFVLSDGLKINGSELVHGLSDVLRKDVVITGGLAGDGTNFSQTWVIDNGKGSDRCVTAVGFYGDRVRVGYGSNGGWDVFGPERTVTRANGSILYELDGKPALPLYKQYLGGQAKDLPASGLLFPLALRVNDSDIDRVVRTVLAVDEGDQSMTFAGDIPQGCRAQLMRANFDRLVDGAEASALMTRDNTVGDGPCLCIAISCVGRRLLLGQRIEEELERIVEIMPETSSICGFYSYGEISPLVNGGCDLHNQTMTLTTFKEV